jgi:triphosphoribosyl-dephospho-CoA synthase
MSLPTEIHPSATAWQIGRAAVRALYAEISLEPKPGLVSFCDSGSHSDMDGATFLRSLFALRDYFPRIAQAGIEGQAFSRLETLGKNAEAHMLRATTGINTHRGAVFSLGLLCASAGQLHAQGLTFTQRHLRAVLLSTWGEALAARANTARLAPPSSNGQRAAQGFQLRSAGEEAAQAFPILFEVTLPALQAALAMGATVRAAQVQALFATMAELDDTNLVHRGGLSGLHLVQSSANNFLSAGGVMQTDWLQQARALHTILVQRSLSPGGSADLLAAACWVDELNRTMQATSSNIATKKPMREREMLVLVP